MKAIAFTVMSLLTALPALAYASSAPPQWEIANKLVRVKLYLPDAVSGFYRGTRFDWSGVIADLQYAGHSYYGPWFTQTDPKVPDFVYRGSEIVAGPCSAITGPGRGVHAGARIRRGQGRRYLPQNRRRCTAEARRHTLQRLSAL